MPPYPAKRVVLTDDQQAVRFQDTRGFRVVPVQVGHPYRNMPAGIDGVESRIAQHREVDHVGLDEVNLQAERSGARARDLDLAFRYISMLVTIAPMPANAKTT